jgi:hypothetical protein
MSNHGREIVVFGDNHKGRRRSPLNRASEITRECEIERIPPRASDPHQFHLRIERLDLFHQLEIKLLLLASQQQRNVHRLP